MLIEKSQSSFDFRCLFVCGGVQAIAVAALGAHLGAA
jgi:hypothetical protein